MQRLRDFVLDGVILLYSFLGLILGFSLRYYFFSEAFLIALIISLILFLLSFRKGKRGVLAFLICLALGIALASISFPARTGNNEYFGVVIKSKRDYLILLSKGRRYFLYKEAHDLEVGDWVKVSGYGEIYQGREYESRFSFAEYLSKQGADYQIKARDIEASFKMPLRLKQWQRGFLAHFNENTSSLIDAIAFGNLDYSSSLIQDYKSIGALYFLSQSGMLYGGALRGFERILGIKLKGKKLEIVSFAFASFLLLFASSKIGVWRIYLCRVIYLAFTLLKKDKPDSLNVICWIGLLTIGINRYLCLDRGFLCGYGIAIGSKLISPIKEKYYSWKGRTVSFLLHWLLILPMLMEGGYIHFLAPLYSFLIMPFTYIFAFLSLLSFVIQVPFKPILEGFSSFYSGFARFLNTFDFEIFLGRWSAWIILFYYVVILLYALFDEIGFRKAKKFFPLSFLSALIINSLPIVNFFSCMVAFVNVGQGDCIIIRDRLNTIMIDTGGISSFDISTESVIPYLRKHNIYNIDCLIESHGDFDHIGGETSLKKNFKVKEIIREASSFPLKIGNLEFHNYNVFGGSDENDRSLVLGLDFMGKKWLFTGDASEAIEKKIISKYPDLDIDILKAGHHGSKTSSSYSFLEAISPEVVVISVGRFNSYGHPNKEVLERLNKLGIKYRRTDIEGTIEYKCPIWSTLP